MMLNHGYWAGWSSFLTLNLSFLSLVQGDWTYKSRPDLAPPSLNITVPATTELSEGYIFIAPYSGVGWNSHLPHGPLQPAPYIFTSSGELVWSGFGYASGWASNFQAARWKGDEVLFVFEGSRNTQHGHSHGHIKILNRSYETIKELRGGNHAVIDLHEFNIVDEKTALVESYEPTPFDLKKYGTGPESQWIVNAIFQEIDIETGRLIFEWNSLDHVQPDESIRAVSSLIFGTGYNSSDALDYFHINSVDRDDEHNYLISGRCTSTIYKINGTSGEIIWRLGGKNSNFTFGNDVEFGLQHHARFVSRSDDGDTEVISFFDNNEIKAINTSGGGKSISSGKLVSVNTQTWKATLLQSFHGPDGIFAFSQGGSQILPNGNAFVNWGSAGAVTELSSNGTVVFHAYLESGELWKNGDVQNYRGFKFNWTGSPHEDPAMVALNHGESTMLYVSWNGDTETKLWKFYALDEQGTEFLLGQVNRSGFETSFYVRNSWKWVKFLAEAQGKDRNTLRRSQSVAVKPYIYKYMLTDDLDFQKHQEVLKDF